MKPSIGEIKDFLQQVERGEVVLEVSGKRPEEVYAGNVAYEANNGWFIVVFNDCNEWDYIDHILDAEGNVADFDEILADYEANPVDDHPANYEATDEVALRAYGIG